MLLLGNSMRDSCTDDLNETNHIDDFVYYYRCQCGHCTVMPTATECVCCHEIDHMDNMLQDFNSVICITSRESFENVCLNVQVAYFSYRKQ